MSRASANVLGSGILLLGVLYALLITGDFDQEAARNYPYGILGFTGIVTVLWLIRSIVRMRRAGGQDESADEPALGTVGGYLVLAGTLLYGAVVVFVGYVLPTVAYIALTAYFLGGRRWVLIGAVAVLFPVAIYAFLVHGFDRPLPF
jgi:hypothetical protein